MGARSASRDTCNATLSSTTRLTRSAPSKPASSASEVLTRPRRGAIQASTSPAVGLSDSAKAVGFYDKGPFQARVAWNWRDDFLAGYSVNPTNPFYRDDYWQIDASASYEFDMGLSVFVEGINLTGENLKGYRRSENNAFFSYRGAPRYAAGVRFSF